MKLLVVSDLHYTLKHYDWVIARSREFDAVVVAGDLLSLAAPVAPEAQIAAIRATLRKLAETTRVFACSGNHDLNALNDAGEKTADWLGVLADAGITTDGASAVVGDTQISVLPWWDGPVAREASERTLAEVDRSVADRWLWVYHSPPESHLSWTGSRHYGDPTVAEWIARWSPDAVLCGHIHQAPFAPDGSWMDRIDRTWVFNPGKQTGPVPTSVELDFTAGTAHWAGMTGVEDRSLSLG